MTKLETAKNEIRAIFANEVECIYETEVYPLRDSRIVIWAREIVLRRVHGCGDMFCTSVINYAIYPDGSWEQVGLGNFISNSSDWRTWK